MSDGVGELSLHNRRCPVCGSSFHTASRGIYCSHACRQQAYRSRRLPPLDEARHDSSTGSLRRGGRVLAAQTIYECPACETRYLGTRRCPDCNLMCRKLGLGGHCLHCDELLLVTELLGTDPAPQPIATAARSRPT